VVIEINIKDDLCRLVIEINIKDDLCGHLVIGIDIKDDLCRLVIKINIKDDLCGRQNEYKELPEKKRLSKYLVLLQKTQHNIRHN